MTTSPELPLPLAPDCDLERLRAHFTAAGWREAAGLPPAEQQPDNDRLLGLWLAPDGASAEWVSDGLVHWLAFRDAASAHIDAAAAALPLPSRDDLNRLLHADEPLTRIAGLRAAALRPDPALAPLLALLATRDAHDGVRAEAHRALTLAVPTLVTHGSALLRDGPDARPLSGPALWSMLGPTRLRRQTLRWLLQDAAVSDAALSDLLANALADPDWEVRAGALIGATRRRLTRLGGAVEQCVWPTVSRDGPHAAHRSLLRAMQQVACALLAGQAPPVGNSPKYRLLARLAALLTAPESAPMDATGLFFRALTTPLDGSAAAAMPLRAAGLEFISVPTTTSWLGGGADDPPARIRCRELLIARLPVGMTPTADPQAMDLATAEGWCSARTTTARQLRLPTVQEWVCAVCGDDGRLFPWGNGFAADSMQQPGPWGTRGHGGVPEWALNDAGRPVRCGSACADTQPSTGRALLRPVLVTAGHAT